MWKTKKELAIIKEVKENGGIVETCRKYSIDPGMYYRYKESYDSSVLRGIETEMRKIMKWNKRLLAKKFLDNALFIDALRKAGERTMNIASENIYRGVRTNHARIILGITRFSFYGNGFNETLTLRRARHDSLFILNKDSIKHSSYEIQLGISYE